MKKLAIFVSGSGTNMENLIVKIREQKLPYDPVVVLCDKPEAKALDRAKRLGVKTELVDRRQFDTKEQFEKTVIEKLETHKVELIALAGFMRILSPDFVQRYQNRLINIHPSYLPQFPGGRAIRDAFEAKVPETGVSVHHVVAEVDAGPIILQRKVPILAGDTLETLEARIHQTEYELYPEALRLLAAKT